MWTKYYYYIQGLRGMKCHQTKHSNRVNYRSNWPLQKTFSSLTPPPLPGFPESLTLPPRRISRIPSIGGVWIFSVIRQFNKPITFKVLVWINNHTQSCNNVCACASLHMCFWCLIADRSWDGLKCLLLLCRDLKRTFPFFHNLVILFSVIVIFVINWW